MLFICRMKFYISYEVKEIDLHTKSQKTYIKIYVFFKIYSFVVLELVFILFVKFIQHRVTSPQ